MKILFAVTIFLSCCINAMSFTQFSHITTNQIHVKTKIKSMEIFMAGFGGGATATKGKSSNKSKKNGKKKKNDQASFDASAALLRSEKLYDKMATESTKRMMLNDEDENSSFGNIEDENFLFSEFVVAARFNPKQSSNRQRIPGSSSVSDWTPVAQICILRSRDNSNEDNRLPPQLTEAISANCREIHHAAVVSAPIFASLPRNDIEYSVETVDSFHKFVYDFVLEQKAKKNKDEIENMTIKEARELLELEADCSDLKTVKKAYRSLSFQYHPDRFIVQDNNEEINDNDLMNQMEQKKKEAQEKFTKVKYAYELIIRSGVTATAASSDDESSSTHQNSWYASLGGRERTDFKGPLELIPLKKAIENIDRCIEKQQGYRSAVCGLDPELVNSFTARNQANAAIKR